MKRRIVVKEAEKNGFWLKRNGASHDIYTNGEIDIQIPRHKDINEITAKEIIKTVRGK